MRFRSRDLVGCLGRGIGHLMVCAQTAQWK